MSDTPERFVVLGKVTGVHGVKGQVKVKSFTDDPFAIGDYGPLRLDDSDRLLEVTSLKPHKDAFLVWFKGVASREQAEALKGVELKVDRDVLPDADNGEFYFADLIGLDVKIDSDEVVGKIVDVVNFGAGDLLDIQFAARNTSQMLPFNQASVPVIDIASGFVVISPPDWMFEEKP